MVRVSMGVVGIGALLGCAGLAPSASPGASDQDALIFRPSARGCDWIRWSAAKGAETLGSTASCPDQVVFKPDGSKVVYTTKAGDKRTAIVAGWPALNTLAELPYPTEAELDWQPLWVAADGVLRLQGSASPEKSERGDEIVLTKGALSTTISKETRILPGDDAFLVAKYEANRKGEGWTLLSVDSVLLDMTLPIPSDIDKDAWPSLAADYRSCNTKLSCEREEWNARADLKGRFSEDTSVGALASGTGSWLFGVQWGDTPHAGPPVFSCVDADCKEPIPLDDLPKTEHGDPSFAIQPQGDYALIGVEWSMEGARIYRLGHATPVYAAPDGKGAGWIPKGG